jgi:hypothetical protein
VPGTDFGSTSSGHALHVCATGAVASCAPGRFALGQTRSGLGVWVASPSRRGRGASSRRSEEITTNAPHQPRQPGGRRGGFGTRAAAGIGCAVLAHASWIPQSRAEQGRAEQSSRAEQPARRISAGSGGCLTSRDHISQEIKREHTLSNKQVHTTHTKRPDKLFLEVTPKRHNKLRTLTLCSGNKAHINLLREHVWTPDYERTATTIQGEVRNDPSKAKCATMSKAKCAAMIKAKKVRKDAQGKCAKMPKSKCAKVGG